MGCIKSKDNIGIDQNAQENIDVTHLSAPRGYNINFNNNNKNSMYRRLIAFNESDVKIKPTFNVKEENQSNKLTTIYKSNFTKDNYEIISKISNGIFAQVLKVRSLINSEIRVMYIIKKANFESEEYENNFNRKISHLVNLTHKNLLKIIEFFSDKTSYYIIVEYMNKCDILESFIKENDLTEKQIESIMKQLLDTIQYLHKKDNVHGLISSDSILIKTKEKNKLKLKLIDVGANWLNRKVLPVNMLYYTSPELLLQKIQTENDKCDIWACGILMFHLLSKGKYPFNFNINKEYISNIIEKQIDLSTLSCSDKAKDLIKLLLNPSTEKRPSIDQCIKHLWLTGKSEINQPQSTSFIDTTIEYMTHFISFNEHKKSLIQLFNLFDKKKTGLLTFEDAYRAINSYISGLSISKTIIDKNIIITLLEKADKNKTKKISCKKFIHIAMKEEKDIEEQNLLKCFVSLGLNNKGKVSKEVIRNILKEKKYKYINKLIKRIDTNVEIEINFEGYKKLIEHIVPKEEIEEDSSNEDATKVSFEEEDSFVFESEEKKANLFDKEKFLKLVDHKYSNANDK